MAKANIETKVYTEYNEQFQSIAWIILGLLLIEMLILECKNLKWKKIKVKFM
jgi:Ca-activated chloride channel family protein